MPLGARKVTMLRRKPIQERGQRRIEVILDAAERSFAKIGYEATTTNAIALLAQTSIGSLYQFFPNKEAILRAVADRYLQRLRIVHDRVLTPEVAQLPLPDIYDRIISALAEFHRDHPGFQPLFHGSETSVQLKAAEDILSQECISRVDAMIGARHPSLPPERRRLLATINVEVIKTLLPLAEGATSAEQRQTILVEIKKLMLGYMQQAVAELPPTP